MWWVKTEDKFKFVKSCEAHIDDTALTVLPSRPVVTPAMWSSPLSLPKITNQEIKSKKIKKN